MADNGSQEEDNQSIDASIGDSDEEMSQQMDSHLDDSESDDNESGGDGQSVPSFNVEDIAQQTSFDSEDRYPELWYNESESHIDLIVNGQTLPTSRSLLMAKSVVFREGLMKNRRLKTIKLFGTTVGAVQTMLHFMLTEELVFDNDNDIHVIADALCCARRNRVNRLVDAIGRHLVPMISADTIETIAQMAFKYRVPGLSDAIDNRLDELLTVGNVLFVTRYSHECGPPSDRFVSTLRAFLVTNYEQLMAKESHELLALNASTKHLWLEVMLEMSKSGVPLAQDVHTLPNNLSSDETQPLLSGDHFNGGQQSPVTKGSAANGSRVQLSQSQSVIDGNPQQFVTKKLRKNCKKTDESEPKPKRMATRSQNTK